jgi:signal transduction histidine kinase
MYKDKSGNLWFGTLGGGLCRFHPEKETFRAYTEKDGLINNTIYSIQEDDHENLWLGTNKGLSRFSPRTEAFINYDVSDGLQSNQFAAGYLNTGASFKGKDGTLYFGGISGLNVFDPSKLQSNRFVPPVNITQFKLFDKLVPGKNEAKKIQLDYDQNFFSFEFAALNYSNSSRNKYAYQLAGIDKDWVYSGTRRLASYTEVVPGKYIFRVKGSNNDGIWNEEGTSIQIIIYPPWWRSWWAYALYALAIVGGIWAFIEYRSRRLKQEKRELEQKVAERTTEVEAQKTEIEAQRDHLENALMHLKTIQTQLIQKEKMASLGEVTAGIAHEIQNPLNFINNFSEVSFELLDELKQEAFADHKTEVLAISDDLQRNLEKIHNHGKRADAIVKGMLQHSRSASGEKQPTDINALTDEYLKLSYHGMRVKNKDFHAALITDFDEKLGIVEVVPQELGRVLLNLFNNAFYATKEKRKVLLNGYQPEIKVTTHQLNGTVEIKVRDNGTGIPDAVKNKIFQPFFTTKPTGEGTGLGLSLSYDIITKGHAGDIRVETEEGEYTAFTILLPLK